MEQKLPNFLIVGAAKSGTTSIYHYLNQHPGIYMCHVKEPRFITAQFVKFPLKGIGDKKVEQKIIKSFDEYKKLFEHINGEKAIGEASADNLYYYENAINHIKKYFGNIKIIIILRNPIERTFSNYQMFVKAFREHLSFEDALQQEEERKNMNWAYGWHYKSVSLYYKQVKAYLDNFRQVKVYFYDDLKADSLGLIRDAFEFLEVDSSFKVDTSFRYNVGGIPKNLFIQRLIKKSDKSKKVTKRILRFLLSNQRMNELTGKLKEKNLEKQQIKPKTRQFLSDFFCEDIQKTENLINRNLSHWLK